mgnify:FL=1
MRKSIKVTVIALTAAILTGGTLYMCRPKENTEVPDNAITESIPTDVKVDIRKTQEDIPEYREITDEETGKTAIAEVQKNEPPETKPTTPPEKPKSEDSYTNPEKPPEYKKEQTVVEKKVETNSETNKKQTSEKGKVYVDGFGYVDKAGETKTQTGVSDGDINKMVGSMD